MSRSRLLVERSLRMAGNYVSLEEAAKILGLTTEALIEMRSRGEIFGYRDGTSWKFKPEEVDRVKQELSGIDGSGISLGDDEGDIGSDVALVADLGSGSDVKLVGRKNVTQDSDDELRLAPEDGAGSDVTLDSSLKIGSGSGTGSDVPLGSGLNLLASDNSDVLDSSDLKLNTVGSGVGKVISGGSDADLGDLELADDDDLVLGGAGSDIALGTDSGINLMSPSDSGISLEDAPLDLAASGISGLDIAGDSGVKKNTGSGSAVNFQKEEEFQLSPSSGEMEMEEDSGSQVIELEDSTEFGNAAVAIPSNDLMGMGMGMGMSGGMDQGAGLGSFGNEPQIGGAPTQTTQVAVGTPEVPLSIWQVLTILSTLLIMCMSGIMVTDIVRNMWGWNGSSDLTSGFTQMVLSAFGMS